MKRFLIYPIFLWLQLNHIMGKPSILDGQCSDYNRSYLSNFSMYIEKSKLYLEMDIITPLQSGVKMDIEFMLRCQTAMGCQRVFQYSLDMCSLLSAQKNNIFKKWFSTFFKYGNFNRFCPVLPKHYYLKGYSIDDVFIPTFFYDGLYRLSFRMIQHKDHGKRRDFIIACTADVELK